MISIGAAPVYSLTSAVMPTGELQALHEGSGDRQQVTLPGTLPGGSGTITKSTGATVHHLGPTDPRETPFAHLRSKLQPVTVQDPSRAPVSVMAERRSSEASADSDIRACKRIKLDPPCDVSSLSTSPLFYRTLYVNSREQELTELQSSYQDHITELFFLENSGNLMDYVTWSKRPNVHLSCLLQSTSLDNTDERKADNAVCGVSAV